MKLLRIMLLLCIKSAVLYADSITVYNTAPQDVFVATYYKPTIGSTASRSGDAQRVPQDGNITMQRPSNKIGSDRQLVISYNQNVLESTIKVGTFKGMPQVNIGNTRGDTFYIGIENGKLDGFNEASWKLVRPVTQALGNVSKQAISKLLESYRPKDFAHKDEIATVRSGVDISNQEKVFRMKRMTKIKDTLKDILGDGRISQAQTKVPTIGLCISGGGYRAMLAGTAFLAAADKMKLLDATMYIAALSGSTWGLTSWLVSKKPLAEWLETLKKVVQLPFKEVTKSEWDFISKQLLIELSLNQKIYVPVIDIWGGHLGAKILSSLGSDTEDIRFSSVSNLVDGALVPMPICTAVADNVSPNPSDYKWIEFTPYEMGSDYLQAWIPIWAFGRMFESGKSLNAVPEETLSYLMGIFGSAISIGIVDILDNIPLGNDPVRRAILKPIIEEAKKSVTRERVVPGAKAPNFVYKLSSAPAYAQTKTEIELVDGGFSGSGNPFPPLLRKERAVDIIIVCDINETLKGVPNLHKIVDYAQKNGLKFPSIDYKQAESQSISVFGDPTDLSTPTIIFLARMQNKNIEAPYNFDIEEAVTGKNKWADTFSLEYSQKNADLLTGWAYRNLLSHETVIKEVIQKRLQALNNWTPVRQSR